MKNFTLGLNIVLVLAVAVLFYFQFSGSKTSKVNTAANNQVAAAGGFKIAYFEMDSVENQYEYLKEMRNALRNLEQQKSNELSSLRNKNKAKMLEYQKDYQKRGSSMSQEEMAKVQEDMVRMDNELKSQEQMKSQELQDESIKRRQEAKKVIEDFLKEYNKGKNYTYILASSDDIIYLKDSVYNITNDMIKGLNDEYKKNKKN